ncbi:hypothetical protein [Pseudoalteromonas sp. G4]|uniref:hypothetical protein n=1 Tax=Pseudoalteromonas sp. G4 TaxID=2992761 RepID=UPI00237EC63F|nr:hypothetical protein [Pseudoalteromonas sp. G4]MDE3274336.1 hypothetical protein [Pseudoalteromonas sp. G4]
MASTYFAFLKKENVPSAEQWQQAIDDLGFKLRLKLTTDFLPFEHEGYLPCQWGDSDNDVGFEVFYDSASTVCDKDDELAQLIGENNYCVAMSWKSSMQDCSAAMIACCALAKSFGAVIYYEGEQPESLQSMMQETQEIIEDELKVKVNKKDLELKVFNYLSRVFSEQGFKKDNNSLALVRRFGEVLQVVSCGLRKGTSNSFEAWEASISIDIWIPKYAKPNSFSNAKEAVCFAPINQKVEAGALGTALPFLYLEPESGYKIPSQYKIAFEKLVDDKILLWLSVFNTQDRVIKYKKLTLIMMISWLI